MSRAARAPATPNACWVRAIAESKRWGVDVPRRQLVPFAVAAVRSRRFVVARSECRAWPASVIGALRLVRRAESTLLVTDGLSDPWEEGIWGAELSHAMPLGFELALELSPPAPEPSAVSRARWATWLLYRLGDQLSRD